MQTPTSRTDWTALTYFSLLLQGSEVLQCPPGQWRPRKGLRLWHCKIQRQVRNSSAVQTKLSIIYSFNCLNPLGPCAGLLCRPKMPTLGRQHTWQVISWLCHTEVPTPCAFSSCMAHHIISLCLRLQAPEMFEGRRVSEKVQSLIRSLRLPCTLHAFLCLDNCRNFDADAWGCVAD